MKYQILILFLLAITCSCNGQNNKIMEDNQPYLLWQSTNDNKLFKIERPDIIKTLPQIIKPVIAYYSTRIPSDFKIDEKYLGELLGEFTSLKQAQDSLLPKFNTPYSTDDIIDILYCGKQDNTIAFWWRGGAHVFQLDSADNITRSSHRSNGRDAFKADAEYLQDLIDIFKPTIPYGKEALSERWIDLDNPEDYIIWGTGGQFSFSETNLPKTYSTFGSGTYIYQSATGELFADVYHLNRKQVVNDKADYPSLSKEYFKIIEKTDTTIIVKTVMPGYEFDWKVGSDSLYRLEFKMIIDHLPLHTKEYKRQKQGIPYNIEGLVESLNNRGCDEIGRMELDANEQPELYPNYIVSGETRGLVEIHKQFLKELGVEVAWNKEKRMYELKD